MFLYKLLNMWPCDEYNLFDLLLCSTYSCGITFWSRFPKRRRMTYQYCKLFIRIYTLGIEVFESLVCSHSETHGDLATLRIVNAKHLGLKLSSSRFLSMSISLPHGTLDCLRLSHLILTRSWKLQPRCRNCHFCAESGYKPYHFNQSSTIKMTWV